MTNGTLFLRPLAPINLKAAAGTLFTLGPGAVEAFVGQRFIPTHCYGVVRTKGGTVTTAAAFRVGTNANHDNIVATTNIPVGTPVGRILPVAFASPLDSPALDSVDVLFEITTAGVGPTAYTADLVLYGLLLG